MTPDEQAIRARLVTANVAANQKWDSWSTQWHKAYGEDVPVLLELVDDLRAALHEIAAYDAGVFGCHDCDAPSIASKALAAKPEGD